MPKLHFITQEYVYTSVDLDRLVDTEGYYIYIY